MKWRLRDAYYIASGCERYTVCRLWVRGAWRYSAFRRGQRLPADGMPIDKSTLLHVGDKAACIDACTQHERHTWEPAA